MLDVREKKMEEKDGRSSVVESQGEQAQLSSNEHKILFFEGMWHAFAQRQGWRRAEEEEEKEKKSAVQCMRSQILTWIRGPRE